MRKKILKGLLSLVIMFLSTGAFCLVGSLSGFAKSEADQEKFVGADNGQGLGATENPGRDDKFLESLLSSNEQSWLKVIAQKKENAGADGIVGATTLTPTKINGEDYYQVTSAEDLALIAYNVTAMGDETWASAKYVQTADIDLAKDGPKLWTPIGTRDFGFRGTYYGNGYTISNIIVDDISTAASSDGKYYGLFGYGFADFVDITINSFQLLSPQTLSNGGNCGALIAYCDSSDFINCHDARTNPNEIMTIGNINPYTSTKIFNGLNKSITGGMNASIKDGFAYTLDAGEGKFFRKDFNENAALSTTKPGKLYLLSSENLLSSEDLSGESTLNLPTKADSRFKDANVPSLVASNLPGLRANATEECPNYAMKAGKILTEYTVGSDMTITAQYDEKTVQVTLNYGYDGVERTAVYEEGYDEAFTTAAADWNLNRVGYYLNNGALSVGSAVALKATQSDSAVTIQDGDADFYIGDTVGGVETDKNFTITASGWTPLEHAFTLTKERAGVESGATWDVNAAVISMSVKQADSDAELAGDAKGSYSGHIAGKQLTITLTLKDGYTLANYAARTAQTADATSRTDATVTHSNGAAKTNAPAGLFIDYQNTTYTGTGADYYSGKGYTAAYADPYTVMTGKISNTNGTTWTITVDNVVSTNANIAILICREELAVPIYKSAGTLDTTSLFAFGSASAASEALLNSYTAVKGGTLYTRVGEKFTLTISNNNGVYYATPTIVGLGTNTSSLTSKGEGQFATGIDYYSKMILSTDGIEKSSDKPSITLSQGTMTITANVTASNVDLNDQVSYGSFNGEEFNGSTKGNKQSISLATYTDPETSKVQLAFKVGYMLNAYWEVQDPTTTIKITKPAEKEGQPDVEVKLPIAIIDPDGTYASFWVYGNDIELGQTYNIQFTFVKRDYALNITYKLNGKTVTNELNAFVKSFPEVTRVGAGVDETYTFSLNEAGRRFLVYDADSSTATGGASITAGTGITTSGVGSNGNSTFTLHYNTGTTSENRAITLAFTTREIELRFSTQAQKPVKGYFGVGADEGVEKAVLPSIQSITLSAEDGTLSINSQNMSVSIVSGYYFLDWYLVNGETFGAPAYKLDRTGYNISGLPDKINTLIDARVTTGGGSGTFVPGAAGTPVLYVAAQIAAKKVNVTYDATSNYRTLTNGTTAGDKQPDTYNLIAFKEISQDGDQDGEKISYIYANADPSKFTISSSLTYGQAWTTPFGNQSFYKVASEFKGWAGQIGASTYFWAQDKSTLENSQFVALFQEVESTTVDGVKYYADKNESAQYDAGTSVLSASITLYPVFIYRTDNVSVLNATEVPDGETPNANKGSLNVRIGDTITLTAEQNSNSSTFKSTLSTSGVEALVGTAYHATGFVFKGIDADGEGQKSSGENGTYTFQITEENVKSILAAKYYFETTKDAAEYSVQINTWEANKYSFVITPRSFETYTRNNAEPSSDPLEIEITYGASIASALGTFTMHRDGYTLKGLTTGANGETADFITCTTNDETSTWAGTTFAMTEAQVKVWAVWERITNYTSVTATGSSHVYNGTAQEIAKGSIRQDDQPISDYSTTKQLPNGEQIVEYGWKKNGVAIEGKLNNLSLSITNVAENPSDSNVYTFYAKIKDLATGKTYDTEVFELKTGAQAKITHNTIDISGESEVLRSYYSGTSTFYGESGYDTIGSAVYGTGGGEVVGLSGLKMRIAGEGPYNVSTDATYGAYYTFSMKADIAANFNNLSQVSSGVYAITLENKIKIVETPITVTASGSGLYVAANVVQYPNHDGGKLGVSMEGFKWSDFALTGTLVTSSGEAYTYKPGDEHNITWQAGSPVIKRSGTDVTANFKVKLAGQFVIESAESATNIVFNAKNLTAANNKLALSGNDNATITLQSFKVSGAKAFDLTEDYEKDERSVFSFMNDEGQAMLTISGNGTSYLRVVVATGYTIDELKVTASKGTEHFMFKGFFLLDGDTVNSELENAVKAGTAQEAEPTSKSYTAANTITAVYTNVKPLTLKTYVGNESKEFTYYISRGGEVAFVEKNARTGFDFADWHTDNSSTGVSVAEQVFSLEETGSLAPATYTARWYVAQPTFTGWEANKKITRNANEEDSIIVAAKAEDGVYTAIENEPTSGITYSYEWFKQGGSSLGTGATHTFKNTDAAAGYYLVVTATYTGNDVTVIEKDGKKSAGSEKLTFELVINKLSITVDGMAEKTLTFNGKDQITSIDGITLTITGEDAIQDALNSDITDRKFAFTIKYKKLDDEDGDGVETTSILNAGVYTITFAVTDTNVYGAVTGTTTMTVTVNKAELTILQTDVDPLSKNFGEEDPDLIINKKGIELLAEENIKFTFTRDPKDNAAGEYSLTLSDKQYTSEHKQGETAIAPDDNYNIHADGLKFYIKKLEVKVYLVLESELTLPYGAADLTASAAYSDGWTITVSAGEKSSVSAKVLSMWYQSGGVWRAVAKELEATMGLNELEFGFYADASAPNATKARNVATYYLKITGANDTFDGVGFATLSGSEVSNPLDYARVNVEKRVVKVTSVKKEFDTTDKFEHTNVTIDETQGFLDDGLTISGTFDSAEVGKRSVSTHKIAGTADDDVNVDNYQISFEDADIEITINKTAEITIETEHDSFEYGTIQTTITQEQLGLKFKAGDLDVTEYITAALTISYGGEDDISTSGYLKSAEEGKQYTVNLQLTSGCYEKITGKSVQITITQKGLTLSADLEKEYDGEATITAREWNKEGLVGKDEVIVSGKYVNAEGSEDSSVGDGKKVKLQLSGKDANNYYIENEDSLTGSIKVTEISIESVVTHKNYKVENGAVTGSEEYVDDKIDNVQAPSSQTFTLQYPGVEGQISKLNPPSRKGYTFLHWEYFDGSALKQINPDGDNLEDFLAAAFANKKAGKTTQIYAVWELGKVEIKLENYGKEYKVTVEQGGELKEAESKILVDYWTESLVISVKGEAGYKFENATFAANGGSFNRIANNENKTRSGAKVTLTHVSENGTLTISMKPISVTIEIDGNILDDSLTLREYEKSKTVAFNDDQLLEHILPQLEFEQPSTFKLVGWQFSYNDDSKIFYIEEGEELLSGKTLWDLVGGDKLEDDLKTGVKFTAQWKAESLKITIEVENAEVELSEGIVKGDDGNYTIDYNKTFTITVKANPGFKYVSYEAGEGLATSIDDETGKGTNNATITVTELKKGGNIKINIETIKVSVVFEKGKDHNYVTDEEIIVKNPEQLEYNAVKDDSVKSINGFETALTLPTNTYTIDGYKYSVSGGANGSGEALGELKFGEIIKDPTADVVVTLTPSGFTGVEYDVKLYWNDIGDDQSKTDIKVKYGEQFKDLPEAKAAGYPDATWTFDDQYAVTKDTYLSEKFRRDDAQISLSAVWPKADDKQLTISYTSDQHITQVSVQVNGEDPQIFTSSGSKVVVTVEDSITITVTFEAGYELKSYQVVIGESDQGEKTNGFENNEFTLSDISDNATVTLKSKPITYKVYIDKQSVESIGGSGYTNEPENEYYLNVNFGQSYSEIGLGSVIMTRQGYTFAGWAYDDGREFATAAGDGLTYTAQEHNVANDIHIRAVWKLKTDDEAYYTAEAENKVEKTYNADDQTITTAKIKANDIELKLSEPDVYENKDNGDKITDYYWVRQGHEDHDNNSLTLKLRDVNESDTYTLVVVISDTLSLSGKTYKLELATVTVTINRAEVEADETWTFESYYTGSSTYSKAGNHKDGGFQIEDKAVTEITANGTIVLQTKEDDQTFKVGEGYSANLYLNIEEAVAANYSNIKSDEQGYYIVVSGVKVVEAPITVVVSGKGFFTGSAHTITTKTAKTNVSGLSLDRFVVEVTITTNDAIAGKKGSGDLTISATSITLKGDQVAECFDVSIDETSSYEIVDQGQASVFEIEGKKLVRDSAFKFESAEDVTFTISQITVDSQNVSTTGEFKNYVVDEEVVFTLSGNGTGKIVLVVAQGKTAEFGLRVNGVNVVSSKLMLLSVVDSEPDAASAEDALQGLSKRVDENLSFTVSDSMHKAAIVTTLKAVEAILGDGLDSEWFYVDTASENATTVSIKDRPGYELDSWNTDSSVGIEFTDNGKQPQTQLKASEGANIFKTSIKAVWKLAKPTYSTGESTFNFDADPNGFSINASEIVTPTEADKIEYRYNWYKGESDGTQIGTNEETHKFDGKSSDGGKYYLTVTAHRDGYDDVTNEEPIVFTVNVAKVKVSISKVNGGEVGPISSTYKNGDIAKDTNIEVTLTRTYSEEKQTETASGMLSQYLTQTSTPKTFYFTAANGESNYTQLHDALAYTITLGVDEDYFELGEETNNFVLTVSPFNYKLKTEDVASLKNEYGAKEVSLTVNLTISDESFAETDNDVTVTFKFKNEGESQASNPGKYQLVVDTEKSDKNYNFTDEDGVAWFEITVPETTLKIKILEPDNLTKVYSGKNSQIKPYKDESGEWYLAVYDFEGEEILNKSKVKLTYSNTAGEHDLTVENMITNAFAGIMFKINDGNDHILVSEEGYVITIEISKSELLYFTNAEFKDAAENGPKFVVTKKDLIISEVTKTFDRNANLAASKQGSEGPIKFSGVVEGDIDDVTISGSFTGDDGALAGEDKEVSLQLGGAKAGNYFIKDQASVKGTITADKTSSVDLVVDVKSFDYGLLKKGMSTEEIKEAIQAKYTLKINGVEPDDVIDENYKFVSIKSITFKGIESEIFSNATYLEAGGQTLVITLESANYQLADNKDCEIAITINKKQFSLADVVVTKEYDDETFLPKNVEWGLESHIESGDVVEVTGNYQLDWNNGNPITLDLSLTGADAGNYEVTTWPNGTITQTTIKVTIDASGDFKFADGESPRVPQHYLEFGYRYLQESDAQLVITRLDEAKPTHTGYAAGKWYYLGGEDGAQRQYVTAPEDATSMLEAAFKNGKSITLQIEWEIEQRTITFTGFEQSKMTSIEAQVGTVTENGQFAFKIDYYGTVTFDLEASTGYKITAATLSTSGSVVTYDFAGVVSKKSATITLTNVKAETVISLTIEDIDVTIVVDQGSHEFASELSVPQDWGNAQRIFKTFKYHTLDEIAESLPELTLEAGTYTRTGWTLDNEELTSEKTLADLVKYKDQEEDFTINITAVWTGVEYHIDFNAGDGKFVVPEEQSKVLTVRFGSKLMEDGELPEVHLDGRTYTWHMGSEDGRAYIAQDRLQDVQENAEAGKEYYELTLYAVYANRTSTLTVKLGDGNRDKVNDVRTGNSSIFDQIKAEGWTTSLTYQDSAALVLSISLKQGYVFEYSWGDGEEGAEDVSKTADSITITNLLNDSTLTIKIVERENILTLNLSNAQITKLGDKEYTSSQVVAKTGSEVVMTFKAAAGYVFEQGDITHDGAGNFQIDFSGIENTEATVTWTEFSDDATLNVAASPRSNEFVLTDSSEFADLVSFNEVTMNVTGGSSTYATGTKVTVKVTLKYGYENAQIVFDDEVDIHPETRSGGIDNVSRLYEAVFEISGFTSDLSFKISASPRAYQFYVRSDMSDRGSVNQEQVRKEFGETVNLLATPNESGNYVFAGWYIGQSLLSREAKFDFVLGVQYRQLLESVDRAGDPITIIAKFDYAERDISIKLSGRGGATLAIGEETENIVENGQLEKTISYNVQFVLTLKPNTGYEVEKVEFKNRDSSTIQDTNSWYDPVAKTVTITVDGNSPATIEVTFKASKAVVSVYARVENNHIITVGSDDGGTIMLTDAQGTKITDQHVFQNVTKEYADYQVISVTDGVLYFVAAPKNEFYSMTVTSPSRGVSVNQSKTTDGRDLFEVMGVYQGAIVWATFTANANIFAIKYVDENGDIVRGGQIQLDDARATVVATGNYSENVAVSVISDTKDIKVQACTGPNFEFEMDGENPVFNPSLEALTNVITDVEFEYDNEDDRIRNFGFSQSLSFTISSIEELMRALDGSAALTIRVKPVRYTIKFYDRMHSGSEEIARIENVTYGQELTIDDATRAKLALGSKDGSSLLGYFTYELGGGKQYVYPDGSNAKDRWEETGYTRNGARFEADQNYDPQDKSFSLFAAWMFEKENITIDFIPDALKKDNEDLDVHSVLPSLNTDAIWMDGTNKLYVEVRAGEELQLDITNTTFEGYKFVRWDIERNFISGATDHGEEYDLTKEKLLLANTQAGTTTIKAVYFAQYNLAVEGEGGIVYATQPEMSNSSPIGYFDTSKQLTIVAQAARGYTFKGWYDQDGGIFIQADDPRVKYDDAARIYSYTFESLLERPVNLTAQFEGNTIEVKINDQHFNGDDDDFGTIQEVTLDGVPVDVYNKFNAKVGQTIGMTIVTEYGYGVTWEGKVVLESLGSAYDAETRKTTYVFTHKITADDIDEGGSIINIKPVATPNKVTYQFVVGVLESPNSAVEVASAGTVYVDQDTVIETDSTIQILFGQIVNLSYRTLANYTLDPNKQTITLTANGKINDITAKALADGNRIQLPSTLLEEYEAGETVLITINFSRMYWTDVASESLQGSGTSADPYIVNTVEDLAFVAKMVNSNQSNGNGKPYAEAVYRVTGDLNFNGRFWTPIGTKESPFNGTFYFGDAKVDHVTHEPFTRYENPDLRFNGIFWVCGSHARITQSNNDLVIALSVVGSILLLLLLLLLILLILRKRRKKRMEELANG